jgi:hypothetical protein
MAPYFLGVPTDFDVPALASVAGVLVVAAATKGGYPLWAIGGMAFLYVLYLAVRCTNLSRVPLSLP